MSLKLLGHPLSICTRRVLLVLAEKNVKFEFQTIDFLRGEHKESSYLESHPFGVIPLLEDGSFKLYESRAVGEYLATKYRDDGPQLLPPTEDVEKCALFRQWASVEYSQFSPLAEQLLMQKMFNPMRGIPCDEPLALQIIKRLEEKLDVLNTILGHQPFMVGESFSLVDIFYMPMVDMLYQAGQRQLFEDRSNLKVWWGKVSTRASWKKISA
ncbi:hypothetical protein AbraIFM66951_000490 [Aspergillus brasiliensis]|nr:hypothetical protein AbraIFM66951_000490 [Aspergillus brasiliensis]